MFLHDSESRDTSRGREGGRGRERLAVFYVKKRNFLNIANIANVAKQSFKALNFELDDECYKLTVFSIRYLVRKLILRFGKNDPGC